MIALYETARRLQEFCLHRRWQFCFIGGLAVLRWGRARLTNDVDMTLLTGLGNEEKFIDQIAGNFRFRSASGRDFALQSRVMLVQDETGIPVDIALGAIPFEARSIERSSLWEAEPGLLLRTCSAEDLLVHKCFAGREVDWPDVENILVRQGKKLNLKQVREELKPLAELKPEAPILATLEQKIRTQFKPGSRVRSAPKRKKRS